MSSFNLSSKKIKDSISLIKLMEICNASCEKSDGMITNIAPLNRALKTEVSFIHNAKYIDQLKTTSAGFCFVDERNTKSVPETCIPLICKDPYLSFREAVIAFYGTDNEDTDFGEINLAYKHAFIDKSAKIGKNVTIMPNVFIGKNVEIGDNVIIHSGVNIINSIIGDNTVIRFGANLGHSGFGFVIDYEEGIHKHIPHLASVVVGKNVDIGANTCIARGFLQDTIIGDNVKIDSLVHISHGTIIGESCIIAGQVGIAGSTELEKLCLVGAQAGIAGHLKIAKGTQIAGQSGVIQNIEKESTKVSGMPSVSLDKWMRAHLWVQKNIEVKNV